MDDLKEYVRGDYLKFDDDTKTIEGTYVSHSIEDDPFTKGDKRVVYVLTIDGADKMLPSKSKRLATRMLSAGLEPGDTISITRHGVGFDIDYEVEKTKS